MAKDVLEHESAGSGTFLMKGRQNEDERQKPYDAGKYEKVIISVH